MSVEPTTDPGAFPATTTEGETVQITDKHYDDQGRLVLTSTEGNEYVSSPENDHLVEPIDTPADAPRPSTTDVKRTQDHEGGNPVTPDEKDAAQRKAETQKNTKTGDNVSASKRAADQDQMDTKTGSTRNKK